MRLTRTLCIVALALSVSGCFLFVKKPPPVTSDCATASTPSQTFLALYSIFYRVHVAVIGASPSPSWPAAPLGQAVEWLRCDPDAIRRPGRIRYATVKLAAGIVLLQRSVVPAAVVAPFKAALVQLVGSTHLVPKLGDSLATTLPGLEDDGAKIIDASAEPTLVDLQRTCCPCIEDCTVGPSPTETTAEFKIGINRGSQCLFHVIDPQCWPSVVPGYVTQTFVVQNSPPCKFGKPRCRSDDPCDANLPPLQKKQNPAQAGTPWCGLAFEDVQNASSSWTSRFKNALKLKTQYLPSGATQANATGFRADYGLCESTYWQMCDPNASGGQTCQEGTCPISRDCGYAKVGDTGVPGWAALSGTKRVRFNGGLPHDGNLWAPIALEVLVKETALATCVPAGSCPQAATPSGCTVLPGPEKCTCAKDHCVQQTTFFPTFTSPFCP